VPRGERASEESRGLGEGRVEEEVVGRGDGDGVLVRVPRTVQLKQRGKKRQQTQDAFLRLREHRNAFEKTHDLLVEVRSGRLHRSRRGSSLPTLGSALYAADLLGLEGGLVGLEDDVVSRLDVVDAEVVVVGTSEDGSGREAKEKGKSEDARERKTKRRVDISESCTPAGAIRQRPSPERTLNAQKDRRLTPRSR
jgi:hypothetical protein